MLLRGGRARFQRSERQGATLTPPLSPYLIFILNIVSVLRVSFYEYKFSLYFFFIKQLCNTDLFFNDDLLRFCEFFVFLLLVYCEFIV